jgi:hypothetical protein
MIEREKLRGLVIATLDKATGSMKAVQLYGEIQSNHPGELRGERVRGFYSFVKCINQFDEVVQVKKAGEREYALAKKI